MSKFGKVVIISISYIFSWNRYNIWFDHNNGFCCLCGLCADLSYLYVMIIICHQEQKNNETCHSKLLYFFYNKSIIKFYEHVCNVLLIQIQLMRIYILCWFMMIKIDKNYLQHWHHEYVNYTLHNFPNQ